MKINMNLKGLGLVLILLLSACGNQQAGNDSFDILTAAKPVPLVVAQGLSLQTRLESGMSLLSNKDIDIATLKAVDFEGNPFVYITFTAPRKIGDIWKFAESLTGDEWKKEGEDSSWSYNIAGASTARALITAYGVGLEPLIKFSKTLVALGGKKQLKRIVAAMPTVFLLEDKRGTFWSIDTSKPLETEQLDFYQEKYEEAHKENNSPKLLKTLESAWNKLLKEKQGKRDGKFSSQAFQYNMDDFTSADGSLELDFAKATLAVQLKEQGGSIKTQDSSSYPICHWVLWWQVCTGLHETGNIPLTQQAGNSGGYQYPSNFGWTSHQFTMPNCPVPYANIRNNAPLGCGPTSFIGLIWREWADGESFYGKAYNHEPQGNYSAYSNSIKKDMTMPSPYMNRPRIANYMGACFLLNGTVAYGKGYVNGGNAFLRDQGKQNSSRGPENRLRVGHNYSHFLGNLWSTGAKANIIRTQIGQNNHPVVAEYWLGNPIDGHFDAITRYRYFESLGIKTLLIQTLDFHNSWYSLSEPWMSETGVYYIEHY